MSYRNYEQREYNPVPQYRNYEQREYNPVPQNQNRQNGKCFKFKTFLNGFAIISTIKYFIGIVYSGIIIVFLPPRLSLVEDNNESEKDEMISMSKRDNSLATAHIVLCLIFIVIGYILFCYGRYRNSIILIIAGLVALNIWDIILGDIAGTLSILGHRETVKNNLDTYPKQEVIHSLNDAYDKIYKIHWYIFSGKMVLLILIFANSFYLLANCKKLFEEVNVL